MRVDRLARAAVLAFGLWPAGGCMAAQPAASTAIDWRSAPVVEIDYAVHFFHPGGATLRLGVPVRLIFRNDGGQPHDFVTNLFTAVAQRPGMRPGGVRVILQPVEAVEYDIVPERPGTYTLTTVMFEPPGEISPVPITIR